MFNLMSLLKSSLTTLLCLIVAFANQDAFAECEDFLDSDFPSEECSFEDLGINRQMLKFGNVDDVSNQSGPISVRFGSATYNMSSFSEVYVAIDDDNCFTSSSFGFDLLDVDNFSPVEEVAFIPSSTNPREIERIWVFRCDSIQSQSR